MKLARSGFAGLQILAHFAEPFESSPSPAFGRRDTKCAPERVAEMAVAGESQAEGERSQIGFLFDQPFQCRAQTQAIPILMNRQSRFTPENAREMKRRAVDCAGDVLQSQSFREAFAQ